MVFNECPAADKACPLLDTTSSGQTSLRGRPVTDHAAQQTKGHTDSHDITRNVIYALVSRVSLCIHYPAFNALCYQCSKEAIDPDPGSQAWTGHGDWLLRKQSIRIQAAKPGRGMGIGCCTRE